jgi:uncharacterized protein
MNTHYVAFADSHRIAQGDLLTVALAVKTRSEQTPSAPAIIFNSNTSRVTDVWLSGDEAAIADWIKAHVPEALPSPPKTRGRPKLGVVSREVTLLPRQWDWLNSQPGGASVTLRKLVDAAAKDPQAEKRAAQDATYRFATALAGDAAGFEEAMRALYAGDQMQFETQIAHWPTDVADHTRQLAQKVW